MSNRQGPEEEQQVLDEGLTGLHDVWWGPHGGNGVHHVMGETGLLCVVGHI